MFFFVPTGSSSNNVVKWSFDCLPSHSHTWEVEGLVGVRAALALHGVAHVALERALGLGRAALLVVVLAEGCTNSSITPSSTYENELMQPTIIRLQQDFGKSVT